jgi:hypothetical protein
MRAEAAAPAERPPPEVVSRILRRLFFYTVEEAGGRIGLTRTPSYDAVRQGIIPAERHGKFLLVRRKVWDAKVKHLMRGAPAELSLKPRRRPRKAEAAARKAAETVVATA